MLNFGGAFFLLIGRLSSVAPLFSCFVCFFVHEPKIVVEGFGKHLDLSLLATNPLFGSPAIHHLPNHD